MLDGLNFKDFVALLSVFSTKASLHHKVECKYMLYKPEGLSMSSIFIYHVHVCMSVRIYVCP